MPQSARLSAGGGVQKLKGQCPNAPRVNLRGASLTDPINSYDVKPYFVPNILNDTVNPCFGFRFYWAQIFIGPMGVQ